MIQSSTWHLVAWNMVSTSYCSTFFGVKIIWRYSGIPGNFKLPISAREKKTDSHGPVKNDAWEDDPFLWGPGQDIQGKPHSDKLRGCTLPPIQWKMGVYLQGVATFHSHFPSFSMIKAKRVSLLENHPPNYQPSVAPQEWVCYTHLSNRCDFVGFSGVKIICTTNCLVAHST